MFLHLLIEKELCMFIRHLCYNWVEPISVTTDNASVSSTHLSTAGPHHVVFALPDEALEHLSAGALDGGLRAELYDGGKDARGKLRLLSSKQVHLLRT